MVKINHEKCLCCGACEVTCPEGFEMDDDGKINIKNPKAKCIQEAIDGCPVQAIEK